MSEFGSQQITAAVQRIRAASSVVPQMAIVLGSGLGGLAEQVRDSVILEYAQIPGFPTGGVDGHAYRLVLGEWAGVPVAVLQGRVHYYECREMSSVVFPVRTLAQLGCRGALLTNAAGGISSECRPGSLMLISDHINLLGTNPLLEYDGPTDNSRFLDMTCAYDPPMRGVVRAAADELDIPLADGVYAANLGPLYETPAEIHMLERLGADAVGMSTVPEIIMLRRLGVRCTAISCISNCAAGRSSGPVTHAEVLENGARAGDDLCRLIGGALPDLAAEIQGDDATGVL